MLLGESLIFNGILAILKAADEGKVLAILYGLAKQLDEVAAARRTVAFAAETAPGRPPIPPTAAPAEPAVALLPALDVAPLAPAGSLPSTEQASSAHTVSAPNKPSWLVPPVRRR